MSTFLKKCYAITFIMVIVMQLNTKAQTDNPISKATIASPTAASLGKYGDIPVSYHTGIPQINIPIYTATAGPLSLPISLSYHASGLKVQEPASWVGAGWALNAGGVITRTVVGAPDERYSDPLIADRPSFGHFSDYGYNNYTYNFDDPAEAPAYGAPNWEYFLNGWRDGEPDLYFFNFGQYTGKFYFRDDRTPVIVPEADFKIEPLYNPTSTSAINPSIQGFTITTPDGVKYYFGNTPGVSGTPPVEVTKPYSGYVGISSWYLNKISSPDSVFSITLTYTPENYGYHAISMFSVPEVSSGVSPINFGSIHGYNLVKNVVQGVRLSKINFPNGEVNFNTSGVSLRTDLSDTNPYYWSDALNQEAKPLGAVEISDGSAVSKKFNFTYSYFTDNTPLPQDIQNFAPGIFTDKQRLKLDKVQEFSGDGSINKPPYNFTYFSEQVPRRLSFGIDHWGFSNGVNDNQGLIPSYTKFGTNVTTNVPGANRDAIWPAMRAGTLQQINYPTGGYTLFEFEPHTVYNTNNSNVNVTLLNQVIHQYGQASITNTASFVSNGTAINMAFNNGANYSATFTIVNSSNAVVYNTTLGNGQVSTTNPLSLPQGTYTATLSLPNYSNLTGGCTANVTQWQTVTTNNTVTIGGNRIKSITNSDGATSVNAITNYDYTGDNGQSSGILYSRPVYVGAVRNDLIKDLGYYKPGTGFVQYPSVNGCLTFPDATCFKSPSSLRPMATTQGNHIGYAEVKVSQTNNGFSKYKFYGATGVPEWQANSGDVVVRTVNTQGCDASIPNFPAAPLAYDYLRGEPKYEAHYNQAGQILNEKTYVPTFVTDIQKTPAFMVTGFSWSASNVILGTYYELSTARKTQMQVAETSYNPADGSSLSTTTNTYYESPYHNLPTRISSTNSKGEVVETKTKYANDFRISTCDAIADGYPQYNIDCANCLATYNAAKVQYFNNPLELSKAYFNYLICKSNARTSYVSFRLLNFMNPVNNFQTNHDNAKLAADAELKPILHLQDNFQNSPIETTRWKNGNLLGATFTRFDYAAVPAGKVYPNKVQAISLATASAAFTNAATSASNTSIIKDSRYKDETFAKFYNGNLAEITSKDGVTTSYLWGYNNTLPIAKANGTNQAALLSAYNAVGGNLSLLRSQFPANTVQLNTYAYTPLKGMISETDANGKSITYEYDGLQRLLLARDFNNNIVKQYDYKYQDAYDATPTNNTPQWIATGQTRCKPCPQNSAYITNILQQEEKDNNPNSTSYNTLRWNDIGTSNACVSNADWQNTTTPVRCRISNITGTNTGEQEQEQIDRNPCSSTGGQTRWIVTGVNYSICPLQTSCNSGNCSGVDKKCVNNVCETGAKVYTSSVRNKFGAWVCTYHYHWSDGSNSVNYTEVSTTVCGGVEI